MKKSQTENSEVQVNETKGELKPFFFSKEEVTIQATSLEEAQRILADRNKAE